jgi:hypothetical protein
MAYDGAILEIASGQRKEIKKPAVPPGTQNGKCAGASVAPPALHLAVTGKQAQILATAQAGQFSDAFHFFALYYSVLLGVARYCSVFLANCEHAGIATYAHRVSSLRLVGHHHRRVPV